MTPSPKASSIREQVSDAEWQARVDLAAAYRLVALYGWDDLIFTHISARVPGADHHFLLNPYGVMFEEVNASSLVKIDLHGNKVMESPYFVNPAGFTIHSAVHEARADALCVMHLHTRHGVAISAKKQGLLPISQQSLFALASIAYHDYEGVALDLDERERLVADIGEKNVMILRNHGTLAIGKNCADAFLRMFYLERACSMQVRALAGGAAPNWPNQGIPEKTALQGQGAFNGMVGAMAWPALRRKCDRVDPSYKN